MASDMDHSDVLENANEWVRFAMKLGAQSILHPFEYSKVLIQVRKEKFCLLFSTSSLIILIGGWW